MPAPNRSPLHLRPEFWWFCLSLMLYLGLPTAQFDFDGLVYSGFVRYSVLYEMHPLVLHDHHILFGLLAWIVNKPVAMLGGIPDVRQIMALMGAFAGAIGVPWAWRHLKSMKLSSPKAIPITILLAGSYAYWLYASDAQVYIWSLLVYLALWPVLLRFLNGEPRPRDPLVSGVCLGLLAGWHVINVLFLPAFVFAHLGSGGKKVRHLWLKVFGLATLTTAVPYGLKAWLFGLSGTLDALKGDFQPANVATKQWFFPFNPWLEFRGILDSLIFVPETLSGTMRFILFALQTILGLMIFWVLQKNIRSAFSREPGAKGPARFGLLWLTPFFLFFSSWDLANPEFVCFLLLPLLFLSALALKNADSRNKKATPWLLPGLAVSIFTCNLLFGFLPQSSPQSNPHLQTSLYLAKHTTPKDLVILSGVGQLAPQKIYIPYFSYREILILDFRFNYLARPNEDSLASIRQLLANRQNRGGRLLFLGEFISDPKARHSFEERHHMPPGYLEALFPFPTQAQRLPGDPGEPPLFLLNAEHLGVHQSSTQTAELPSS